MYLTICLLQAAFLLFTAIYHIRTNGVEKTSLQAKITVFKTLVLISLIPFLGFYLPIRYFWLVRDSHAMSDMNSAPDGELLN